MSLKKFLLKTLLMIDMFFHVDNYFPSDSFLYIPSQIKRTMQTFYYSETRLKKL